MAKKAKRFRIGVEGATTDGRKIERNWLTQMAANYDPTVYTALINMEHIKGYTPDSPFRRYGKVSALFAEEITKGKLAGKMALSADIEPTDDLVLMNKKGQKLFTSMEINPDFSDTGEAYLVGLAVTDDPASLGTEILEFSAGAKQNPLASRKLDAGNLFSAAEETLLEFEEIPDPKPALFTRIKELFSVKQTSDDARFHDVHQAVGLVAEEHQSLSGRVDELAGNQTSLSEGNDALQQNFTELKTRFDELEVKLSSQDGRQDFRPRAPGGNSNANEHLTNC